MDSLDDQPAEEQPDEPDDLINLDLQQRLALPHGRGVCTEPVRFAIPIDTFGKWIKGIIGLVDWEKQRAWDAPETWTFPPITRAGRTYYLWTEVTHDAGPTPFERILGQPHDSDGLQPLPDEWEYYHLTCGISVAVPGADADEELEGSDEQLNLDDRSGYAGIPDAWEHLDPGQFRTITKFYARQLVALITLRPLIDGCKGHIDYLPVVTPWIDVLKCADGSPWRDTTSPSPPADLAPSAEPSPLDPRTAFITAARAAYQAVLVKMKGRGRPRQDDVATEMEFGSADAFIARRKEFGFALYDDLVAEILRSA